MKHLFCLLTLPLALGACRPEAPPAGGAPVQESSDSYDVYGAALTAEGAVPVTTLLAAPGEYVGQQVKMEGQVSEVCQARGCWATLVTDAGTVRIQMPRNEDDSDYLFTLPKDISGRRVVAAGLLEAKTTTAEEQRHYDEDKGAAQPIEAYADKTEYLIKPSGVLVQKS